MYNKLVITGVFVISSVCAQAQDRLFANTYQSLTLPKGEKDIEIWNSHKTGRTHFYHQLTQQLVVDYGLADRIQTSIGLNISNNTIEPHPGFSVETTDPSVIEMTKSTSISISSEWKFKISDPNENGIGSAFYAAFIYAPHEIEFEGIIIIDKKIGKNILSLNIIGEYDQTFYLTKKGQHTEKKLKPEMDFGYMRMIYSHLGIGLELRNQNVIIEKEVDHSALFGGPTLTYFRHGYFVNLNVSPQLANLHQNEHNQHKLDLNEYEKIQARLIIGFVF